MRVLTIFAAVAIALLGGCSTQKRVATLEGHGTKQIYNTGFDQAWRAAIDAAQGNDLEIINSDRSRGYIGARRTIRMHTFGENVGIWVHEIAPAKTEVEVVSRQAGPPVASWRNWENEIQRTIAANITREAVGTAPRNTVIERGTSSPKIVVPESRETIVVPESRSGETIVVPETSNPTVVVPETRNPTVVVPETSRTREALREEQRRLDDLRTRRDAGERALANEVDDTKRDMLQREIDRLREDQRLQQKRLEDLERQLK